VHSHFHGSFDIVHSDFIARQVRAPYEKFVSTHGVDPARAAMFEDIARNLEVPHVLGMTTVLVTSPANVDGNLINDKTGDMLAGYVDHRTDNLAAFLARVLDTLPASSAA
jgi:putative hydrolase of the HAD superfamily